jgi:hypothetical protein
VRWALVRPDGGIAAQSGGIALSSHTTGTYVLTFGTAVVTGKPIIASFAYAGDGAINRGNVIAGPCGAGAEGVTCGTANVATSVQVQTTDATDAAHDQSFYVAVFG